MTAAFAARALAMRRLLGGNANAACQSDRWWTMSTVVDDVHCNDQSNHGLPAPVMQVRRRTAGWATEATPKFRVGQTRDSSFVDLLVFFA
jgi:hypothetical protein